VKYIDKDGDVWEEAEDNCLRLVEAKDAADVGITARRDKVADLHGPLRTYTGAAGAAPDAPSDDLPRVTDVMDRATVFQSAHALVTGLKWGESESPSVYDVLSVAKWLEGDA
jgi:hypothetical protein